MAQAYIVAATRTAGGRRGGRLQGWHPADLAGLVLDELVRRAGADPAHIDDVIMGCVSQAGEQSTNIARNAVLSSGLPESVPGTSIDRQCGSSQQALHFAAQAVMSGTMDMVIAAGVESMSRVPMGMPAALPEKNGLGQYKSQAMEARYPGVVFNQFEGAQRIAQKYGFSRADLDGFALDSHRKAIAAAHAGLFDREILPVPIRTAEGNADLHRVDEGIRFNVTAEGIAQVKPLVDGGTITPANASQMCDGASGVLVVNERGLKRLGIAPLARVHHMTVVGEDPVIMLEAPIGATLKALDRSGLSINDIDLFEVNEAFASIPLSWLAGTGADPARLNVHGGAIALGHPLGATGTKLMTSLIHALHARNGRYGLQVMCEGGGLANVTIVERL